MEAHLVRHGSSHSSFLEHCLGRLREHKADLYARGVRHAAIFGSVARGMDKPDSDVDVLIEVRRGEVKFGFTDHLQLEKDLARIFGRPVDVMTTGALKTPKHDSILLEMIAAF